MSTISFDRDADDVVTLTIDDPDATANTLTEAFLDDLSAIIDQLEAEVDTIAGVVLTSGKTTFLAGADLTEVLRAGPEDAQRVFDRAARVKHLLRRLELLGRPVVAALNGTALGGGLELALACHHRIAADVPESRIGLPEVTLGVLPGAGGVVRTVRLLGVQRALTEVLLPGARMRPGRALATGLVDELVPAAADVVPAAKKWLKAHPDAHVQPWDAEDFRIPGGSPDDREFLATLPAFPANLRKQLKGQPLPAPRAAMAAAVEGAQVGFDTACVIETRYFVSLVTGPVAKNMIQAFFFDLQAVRSGNARPADVPERPVRRVGVLGAGMMGAGIAHASAKAGFDVVLKDVTLAAAQAGKSHAETVEAKRKTTEEQSRALLARITPTADSADLAGADLVVEAVFEDSELKARVFREAEAVVSPDAVLGSNTSSLPITGLAEAVQRPENFVGIHFFSPVEKREPVEIIRGAKTSDETLARAIDYVLAIGKFPIVVNDGRGFFTTRVFSTYLTEAVQMLSEGVPAATVEQAGRQAGYPAAPLQLADELGFGTIRKIIDETAAAGPLPESAVTTATTIATLMDDHGRTGKHDGAGFYDYADGRRTRLWPGVPAGRPDAVPFGDLRDRFLFIQAIEAQLAFDEGIVTADPDANIGSVFGFGYPAWTGGVRQFVTGYPGGREAFTARAGELASRYGPRFQPPPTILP